jgi:hypothetical protein
MMAGQAEALPATGTQPLVGRGRTPWVYSQRFWGRWVGVAPPPSGDEDTVLAKVDVAMHVEGGYFQVVDFFRRIEVDVPRAVLMSALGISEAQDEFPLLSTNWNGQLFTVIPDPVLVGQQITYTLTARNNGPSTATGVVLADTLLLACTELTSDEHIERLVSAMQEVA